MDKKVHTWIELAENDLEFAGQILQNNQRPHYAAHFCHQAIEKILKAIVQRVSGEAPPKVHNLERLLQLTNATLPEEQLQILLDLAPHYLGTKYPADLTAYYKQYTGAFAKQLFESTKGLFLWLKSNLLT